MFEDRPARFDGLSAQDVGEILARLEPSRFPSEATIIAEGDVLHEPYSIRSGACSFAWHTRAQPLLLAFTAGQAS